MRVEGTPLAAVAGSPAVPTDLAATPGAGLAAGPGSAAVAAAIAAKPGSKRMAPAAPATAPPPQRTRHRSAMPATATHTPPPSATEKPLPATSPRASLVGAASEAQQAVAVPGLATSVAPAPVGASPAGPGLSCVWSQHGNPTFSPGPSQLATLACDRVHDSATGVAGRGRACEAPAEGAEMKGEEGEGEEEEGSAGSSPIVAPAGGAGLGLRPVLCAGSPRGGASRGSSPSARVGSEGPGAAGRLLRNGSAASSLLTSPAPTRTTLAGSASVAQPRQAWLHVAGGLTEGGSLSTCATDGQCRAAVPDDSVLGRVGGPYCHSIPNPYTLTPGARAGLTGRVRCAVPPSLPHQSSCSAACRRCPNS